MAFNPKDLGAYKEFLDTQSKISKVMSKSSKDFALGIKDAVVAKRDLAKAQKQFNKLEQEELEIQNQINKAQGEEKKILEEKLKLVKEEKKATKEVLEQQKALSAALSKQVGSVKNLTLAVGRDLFRGMGKVLVKAKELGKEFSQMDDAMRRTATDIGLAGKQFNMLRKNAYKAALMTDRIGVGAKELVESYGTYADEVGRLIPLTEKAGKAMAYMGKGTALGMQGAAQMAASMEVMGLSIESTAGYVEDVTNMTAKMGVNSGKTLKLLASNMRKAQTVRFKGGVDGMAKMAAKAVAMRADMAATLGLAQDLWEPEKAIETAASLQMMGGAFAKMADPMKLMFDARNNPAKLMTDLAEAASQSAVLRNGQYEISSMELTRLREVAKTTGLDFESLVEQAKTAAKRNDIGKFLNPRIAGDQREFIKNIATMTEDGKFKVGFDGEMIDVQNLTQEQIKAMMAQDKTLQKRAEESQGFMTRLQNLLKSLKNLASSFFAGMDGPLKKLLDSLTGRGEGSLASLSDQMYRLGEQFGTWIAESAKPFIEKAIPMIGALTGKLTTAVAGTADFFKNQVLPATQGAMAWLKKFWDENGPFIKKVLEIVSSVSKLIWKGVMKIYETFDAGGVLATIILVKFPSILRGLLGGVGKMLGGVGRMFGQRGSSPANPMFVSSVGGGMGGGPMDMMGMGMPGGRYKLGFGGRMMKGLGNMLGGRRTMLGRTFRGMAARSMGYGGGFMRGGAAGMSKLFGRNAMGAVGRTASAGGGRMAGGILARAGRGMAAGGPLALLGVGAEVGRMFMDDPDTAMGKTLGVVGTTASDAATGMLIGSIIPGIGTAVGGIIGGIIGFGRSMYREMTTKGKSDFDMSGAKSKISGVGGISMAGTGRMADGAVMPNGNVIKTAKGEMYKLAPKDVMSIGQPGSGGGGASGNVSVNISGTINLAGGGTSVSLDGLMNDPVFKAEVTKVVIEGMKNNNR